MDPAYVDLQLAIARSYAAVARVGLQAGIERCTNLRRRLQWSGLQDAQRWQALMNRVGAAAAHPAVVLELFLDEFESGQPPAAVHPFGCFGYDAPDAEGTLRLHFMPPEGLGASPFAPGQRAARRDELRALFGQVRRLHGPDALEVRGLSWLYNLPVYLALFPAAYRDSAHVPTSAVHLNGSSTWGQVLDWRQRIKPHVRDRVLAQLPLIEPRAPEAIFPMRALAARAAISHFHDWFQ